MMIDEINKEDYWPCDCVKRDKQGNMSHIKLHHKSVKRCRKCGCTPLPDERLKELKQRATKNE